MREQEKHSRLPSIVVVIILTIAAYATWKGATQKDPWQIQGMARYYPVP